ncbi:hypothetical protein GCM10028799_11650 [Kribbella italica]
MRRRRGGAATHGRFQVSDRRGDPVSLTVWTGSGPGPEPHLRPKATFELQIFAFATGLPGFEACHSVFAPA